MDFFFLISEKRQPFSLTQNSDAIKVKTDKFDYIKKKIFLHFNTCHKNSQMTNN